MNKEILFGLLIVLVIVGTSAAHAAEISDESSSSVDLRENSDSGAVVKEIKNNALREYEIITAITVILIIILYYLFRKTLRRCKKNSSS